MKKKLIIVLAVIMAICSLGLIACGTTPTPTPTTYTITFMTGETTYKTQSVKAGDYITPPTDPTSTEGEFAGWYKEATFVNKFDFASEKPTKNMTLYAKFDAETPITVNFYDTDTLINTQEVKTSSPLTLDSYAKKGYQFDGWTYTKGSTIVDKVAGATLTKAEAEEHAVENVLSMYAVLEKADLTVAVWSKYFVGFEDNLALVKSDFAKKESTKIIEYREYSQDTVADFGSAINTDGDVNVILGSGANITSKGGVAVVTKAVLLEKYQGTDSARQAALVTDNELSDSLYSMVTGLGNATATVNLYNEDGTSIIATGVVKELTGNSISYTAPTKEGATFDGWATTKGATVALIAATTSITYSVVKDNITDDKVDLYPVFKAETYDLVVYVHLNASAKTTYITADEFTALKEAFAPTDKKIKWVGIEGTGVSAFTTDANANADVVIAGKWGSAITIVAEGDGCKEATGEGWIANGGVVGVIDGKETNTLAIELWNLVKGAKPTV